ncbi:Hypothetical predicted protein [Olea europaea subsp. europaea]|uniref:Uncharacterized protein n=1 Tax=Olea europaea subsp. europaea TaxID=158383 RepID=A0A8S0VDP7_OLEEU|nr:Hypothetical predicted protein [Olea europaea subsp. europaea]
MRFGMAWARFRPDVIFILPPSAKFPALPQARESDLLQIREGQHPRIQPSFEGGEKQRPSLVVPSRYQRAHFKLSSRFLMYYEGFISAS